VAGFALTPTLSPRRGNAVWPGRETTPMGSLSPRLQIVLPLPGERVGVRESVPFHPNPSRSNEGRLPSGHAPASSYCSNSFSKANGSSSAVVQRPTGVVDKTRPLLLPMLEMDRILCEDHSQPERFNCNHGWIQMNTDSRTDTCVARLQVGGTLWFGQSSLIEGRFIRVNPCPPAPRVRGPWLEHTSN